MPSERYLQLRKQGVRDMHNFDLLRACKEDNELLEDFLCENRDFIFSIIIKYKGNVEELKIKFRVDEEEILQHAYIGVLNALRDFDLDRGIKFTTYVVRPILWEINQLLYNDSRLVRLSRGAIDLIKRMKEVEDTLGYLPPEEEMSMILKVPVDRIREIVRFTTELERIDGMENFELKDRGRNAEEDVVNRVYVEQILTIANLSDFDREIAELIMVGLNNSQIAERMNVYPMTINRAINRIKNKIENSDINDKRTSKYEKEIALIADEIAEIKSLIEIDDMQDLLDMCGFDTSEYTPRILYYIRQRAVACVVDPLEAVAN
ncbi:sigma-70 family RNA polymerase sigma factor [Brevibacillus laterosporus]|uniref:sigma-70 family RNA polymerase sigma factor n=1 Tax=Brevibacillus laterosporus TaxID=1465 RepID=UPI003D191DC9